MQNNLGKLEHVLLGQLKHKFTVDNIRIAIDTVRNNGRLVDFMFTVPGVWSVAGNRLRYTDSGGVMRTIVPQERVSRFLQAVYENAAVPKGQASFSNWIADHYIGVSQRRSREFIASKAPLQMMRNLQHKPTKNQRIVRGKRPFAKISADLGDLVSFTKKPNDSDGRYFLVVVCDFCGYIFAERLDGKSGKLVSVKLKKIFNKIRKTATVGTMNSDLGTDFRNPEVRALCKQYNIVHIKPKVARISPSAECAVRNVKRYLRINSHILQKTYWWEVLQDSVHALNHTRREEGFTPHQIVRAFRERGKDSVMLTKFTSNRRNTEKEDMRGHLKPILQGDYVRLRLVPDKVPPGFKSHLGFRTNRQDEANSWSTELYQILKIKNMRVHNKQRFLLDNKEWRDRYELLLVPPGTINETKRELELLPKYKKKISSPALQKTEGRRSSRLRKKKRINYSEL